MRNPLLANGQIIGLICLGAIAGAELRYALVRLFQPGWTGGIPWTTAFINISGSFLIGLIYARVCGPNKRAQMIRLLIATGLLGSYTTFSTFSYETMTLIRQNEIANAIAYTAISLLGGLILCRAGYETGRQRTQEVND
jgi:CrcB protein